MGTAPHPSVYTSSTALIFLLRTHAGWSGFISVDFLQPRSECVCAHVSVCVCERERERERDREKEITLTIMGITMTL